MWNKSCFYIKILTKVINGTISCGQSKIRGIIKHVVVGT